MLQSWAMLIYFSRARVQLSIVSKAYLARGIAGEVSPLTFSSAIEGVPLKALDTLSKGLVNLVTSPPTPFVAIGLTS